MREKIGYFNKHKAYSVPIQDRQQCNCCFYFSLFFSSHFIPSIFLKVLSKKQTHFIYFIMCVLSLAERDKKVNCTFF